MVSNSKMLGVSARLLRCACSSFHYSHFWRLYMVSPHQFFRLLVKYKGFNLLLMYRNYHRRYSGRSPKSRFEQEPYSRPDPVLSGFIPKAMVPQTGATHLSPIFGRCSGSFGSICVEWLDIQIPRLAASIILDHFLYYVVCPQPSNRLVIHFRMSQSWRSVSVLREIPHSIFCCPSVQIHDI